MLAKKNFRLTICLTFAIGLANPCFICPQVGATELSKTVSLTLRDCYELALKRSEKIAIQKEKIEETEAQFLKAISEAAGDVDFVISNTRQDGQKGASAVTYPASRRERKFTISQPLFQGFKSLGAIAGAGSLRGGRKENRVRAEQLLFLDVVDAFYTIHENRKNMEITQDTQRLLEERMNELKARENIGRSRPSEVATANSKLKTNEADLARFEGLLNVSVSLLEFLTGIPIKANELSDEDIQNQIARELPEYLKAVDLRPDVKASKQSVKTAWQNIVIAQSGLWPQMTFEHNQYEKREGAASGIDWDVLFKISIPIFKGGETAGEIKEAVSEWKIAKSTQSETKRLAELEIKQTYQYWVASMNESKALQEAVKASDENFQLQKEEYSRNLVNNLDVLDALKTLNENRSDANHGVYAVKKNYWKLQVAIGKAP